MIVTETETTGKVVDDQIIATKTGAKEVGRHSNSVVITKVDSRNAHRKTTRNNNLGGIIISHSGHRKIKITTETGNNLVVIMAITMATMEATTMGDNLETGRHKTTSRSSRGEIMRILSYRRHSD